MSGGFLTLGDNYKVPLELFQWNRDKLRSRLWSESSSTATPSIVVLHGGPSPTRYDTDHEPVFRQESYFWWLTGVKEPDCSLILTPTKWILFIPHLPPDYATVMGRIKTCTDIQMEYGADQVLYIDDFEMTLTTVLDQMPAETRICVMKGRNTDSGNDYDMGPLLLPSSSSSSSSLPNNPRLVERVDEATLFPILADCRVTKSPHELRLMEHVTQVTSFAHAYVMRNIKPFMWEYQAESLFRHYTYYNYGSRLQSYTSICGCGPNAAILHYGHAGEPNSRQLQPTDQCLFDMGAEYQCYASDITCSFPANGRFSEKYKPIYQAVLDAQVTVYQMLRPGVSWVDCHKAAEASILQSLLNIGLITLGGGGHDKKTINDLVELRLGAVFMPHGLGHLIGIDTHDVGGYLPGNPPRILEPGLAKLRTARIIEPNMVLTVEPGCYFIDHLLDGALTNPILSPHLCADRLSEYRGYGGVRLEDVVWIPPNNNNNDDNNCVNFTLCPRTIEEVEYVMAGGNWPPTIDDAPELRRVNLTKSNSPLGPPPSN